MKLLNVLCIEQLNEHIHKALEGLQRTKMVDVKYANNYVIASDIFAIESVPSFLKSRVDGYALVAKMTQGASESMPIILKEVESISIGMQNNTSLDEQCCQYLNTGTMLPHNANAVVMIEQTEKMMDDILIYHATAQNEHVTQIGQDVMKGTLLLKQGVRLDERKIALLMSCGISQVEVYDNLRCVIVSSGNELIEYQDTIRSGQVRDVNTILIETTLKRLGVAVVATHLIKDDMDLYEACLRSHDADIYIVSGGSSKGSEDYTYDVFEKICGSVVCHGLAIKPGKPTLFAYSDKALYLGLPGNPVSAYIVLLQTMACVIQDIKHIRQDVVDARVAHNINASAGKATVVLVSLEYQEDVLIASPIYYQSSQLQSLADADGYFVIDKRCEGVNKMDWVKVIRL